MPKHNIYKEEDKENKRGSKLARKIEKYKAKDGGPYSSKKSRKRLEDNVYYKVNLRLTSSYNKDRTSLAPASSNSFNMTSVTISVFTPISAATTAHVDMAPIWNIIGSSPAIIFFMNGRPKASRKFHKVLDNSTEDWSGSL